MNYSLKQHNDSRKRLNEEHTKVHIGKGIQMKECTVKFLNAVMDPFKSDEAARVPDLQKQQSVCMRDYVDDYVPVLTDAAAADLQGVLIYWTFGPNAFGALVNGDDIYENFYWQMWIVPVASDEVLYTNNITGGEGINASTILSMSTGLADNGGLANAFRIFAGGIKALPTIELITDSNTIAVRNFWGGTLRPSDLANIADTLIPKTKTGRPELKEDWVQSTRSGSTLSLPKEPPALVRQRRVGAVQTGLNIIELLRNQRNVVEFPNNTGVTVRYDPFQYEEQLEFISNENVNMNDTVRTKYNTSHVEFPFIFARFLNPITSGSSAPLRLFSTWWLEAEMVTPTPIYTTKSPVDLNFNRVRSMCSDTDRYPVSTRGHSFKSFIAMANSFVTDIEEAERELRPVSKFIGKVGKQINRAVKKRKRKKRKRKKAKRTAVRLLGMTNANTRRINKVTPNN